MLKADITIAGAGILGLWQALTLARRGASVEVLEASPAPFEAAASRHAGTMLAPDCEAETQPPEVHRYGHEGLALWRETYPHVTSRGTLVVAAARDAVELARLARMTTNHASLDAAGIARLEPDLGGRFPAGLHFEAEAHVATPAALDFLLRRARDEGVIFRFGTAWDGRSRGGIMIDCRGLSARARIASLRGVRGERVLIETDEMALSRPVRLLHPRHPVYVVPWGSGRFLVGATMIESEDAGPVSVRSMLELLGGAYALAPALAEARVIEAAAGVRPALPDNVPRAIVRANGRDILVNGAYRHGYLLAPILARAVADFLAGGRSHPLIVADSTEKPIML